MKNIEAIKLILKEKPNENIYTLFTNNSSYNLIYLCVLNEKYLNKLSDQILNNLNYSNISNIPYLLSNFPNLIDKIPNDLLNKLNIPNWINILSNQPLLFDKCNIIDKFESYNLYDILSNQPLLINKCKKIYKNKNTLFDFILNSKEDLNIDDFNSLNYLDFDINAISISSWLDIFKYNPDLIKICPIVDKINKSYNEYKGNVIDLVSKQINFKYLLPSIDKISNYHLSILIANQLELIEDLNIDFKKFNENEWTIILSKQPQLINKCDKLKELSISDWYTILTNQPKLIDYCNKIDEFNSYIWYFILRHQPKLIDYCNKIDEFSSYDWCLILKEQPKLIDYCDKIDEFKGNYWYELLMKQPQLINECKNINIIKRMHKIQLLNKYPNLIEKIHLNNINNNCVEILYNSREHHLRLMKRYIKKYKDKNILTNMIGIYPDLKDLYTKNNLWQYVDFSKLTDNLEYSILK